jgi:hypothetical protein
VFRLAPSRAHIYLALSLRSYCLLPESYTEALLKCLIAVLAHIRRSFIGISVITVQDNHSRILIPSTAVLLRHHLFTCLSPLHSSLDSSLALGIIPFGIGVPCPLVSSVLGISLPPLFRTRITSYTVISSLLASYHYTPLLLFSILAILPTTQIPYRKHTNILCGTQLFSAIQCVNYNSR